MTMRAPRGVALSIVAIALVATAARTWGIGFFLGQSKDELKLKYEVSATDHGTGRVTIVLTIEDEGRLAPLDEVELAIPGQEKNEDGGQWMDLVVAIKMRKADDGKRVGRVHIRRDLAARAELWLNTHTMDGKLDPLTRLHHVIPVANFLKQAANAKTD